MLSGKPGKFLYLDGGFYYLGEGGLSGRDSYPEITVGPGLQRLLRPGRLCLENGKCGWLIIRKRRNAWYVYLQSEKQDIYLGPLTGFRPVPISLTIRIEDGKLLVDVSPIPASPVEVVGAARSLAAIAASLGDVEKLLNQLLSKYKVR